MITQLGRSHACDDESVSPSIVQHSAIFAISSSTNYPYVDVLYFISVALQEECRSKSSEQTSSGFETKFIEVPWVF